LRNRRITPHDPKTLFNSLYDDPEVYQFAIKRKCGVRIGVVGEPFPAVEKKYQSTLRFIKLLQRAGIQYDLTTKRPHEITQEHIDVLTQSTSQVRVSFSTTNDAKAKILEPGCIAPSERLRHMKRLNDAGVVVGGRFAPFFHNQTYDYQAIADTGAETLTVELFRFSMLWRHSTDPKLWEVLSGEKAPSGDVTDKKSAVRQWVEQKEHEYFAPLQNLERHAYYAPRNLWVYTDIFKLRELWTKVRDRAHKVGLHFGVCSEGCGIHNIDLTDPPCGCIVKGFAYDQGALVPSWHRNKWDDWIVPSLWGYSYDVALDRFIIANSEFLRPIALDNDPRLLRAGLLDAPEVDELTEARGKEPGRAKKRR
jgi:DNA repair photolyase